MFLGFGQKLLTLIPSKINTVYLKTMVYEKITHTNDIEYFEHHNLRSVHQHGSE